MADAPADDRSRQDDIPADRAPERFMMPVHNDISNVANLLREVGLPPPSGDNSVGEIRDCLVCVKSGKAAPRAGRTA